MKPNILFATIMITSSNQSHNQAAMAMLLSEIPTPSFVIDIDALPSHLKSNNAIPYLHLPNYDKTLSPTILMNGKSSNSNDFVCSPTSAILEPPSEMFYIGHNQDPNRNAVGYLHSSVIRARENANEYYDKPKNTFLAEVDLTHSLCYFPCKDDENNMDVDQNNIIQNAQIVLGLNNHHVGSYYWARSAGAGASMEAPGVSFRQSSNYDDRGILRWDAEGGPLDCNSNDGKRSEWVNFLRVGDNVQFVPRYEERSIMAFLEKFGFTTNDSRIFGISAKGRPLGSEPKVTCKWILNSNSFFNENDNKRMRIS